MNSYTEVFNFVKKIPKGKVTTYKTVGDKLNINYRKVGKILSKNTSKEIPCHRVIKSNREIGGYNKGIDNKIKILQKENIQFEKTYKDKTQWKIKKENIISK